MSAPITGCCSVCDAYDEYDSVEDPDDVERVSEAARLLDRALPSWFRRIDPAQLRMASRFSCVLGQVYGEYDAGLTALEVALGEAFHDAEVTGALRAFGGFVDEVLWVREVDQRRASC